MSDGTLARSLSLLRTRRFDTFWFASLLSNIGTWAQQVAQPWLMLSLGASAFLLGLDAFAMGAPLVLLLLGTVRPWMIIGLSFVVGITDALSMPSFQSIVPSIVERDQLPAGLALNSTQFNLSRILGPALAGLPLAAIGATGAFAVSAASYVSFILVALWILPRGLPPVARDGGPPHPYSGLVRAARVPALRGALATVFTTGLLCAPLITFCPVFIRDTLHGAVAEFSVAVGAFGIGGLIGATGLLAVDARRDRRPLSAGAALAWALAVVLVALGHSAATLPALFVLAGVAMIVSNVSANTVLQSHAPAHIRGQAVSLFMLATRAARRSAAC